jgi:NMD protein affecting ribosome stability and mRNA decay
MTAPNKNQIRAVCSNCGVTTREATESPVYVSHTFCDRCLEELYPQTKWINRHVNTRGADWTVGDYETEEAAKRGARVWLRRRDRAIRLTWRSTGRATAHGYEIGRYRSATGECVYVIKSPDQDPESVGQSSPAVIAR